MIYSGSVVTKAEGGKDVKILYETADPRNPRVQINYLEHTNEFQCFGLSCSVPRPGDRIIAYAGPQFEIISASPYGSGFQGWCKEVK